MEAHLLPTNALLGLVTPGDINPAALAEAGFRVVGLEIPVIGLSGKAVIDVLLFHDVTNHFVQCESKSGANVEERQAKAYTGVSAQAIVQAANVNLAQRTPPTVETLYACTTSNVERIRLSIKSAGVAYPVLAVGDGRIGLFDGDLASDLLGRSLAAGVSLLAPPARILPFDLDSSPQVIERHVLATMVAMLSRRVPHSSLTGLTEQATPHYVLYGQKAQNKLRAIVGRAVGSIAQASPEKFAYEPPANGRPEGMIRFLKTPEDADRRGRTQSYQSLGRGKVSKAQPSNVGPDLLDLLAELDATEPADDDGPPNGDDESSDDLPDGGMQGELEEEGS